MLDLRVLTVNTFWEAKYGAEKIQLCLFNCLVVFMYFVIQLLLQNKVILCRIRNAEAPGELVLSREDMQPNLPPNRFF